MKGISLFQESLDFHRFAHPFQQIDPDGEVDLSSGRSTFHLTVPHLTDYISGVEQRDDFAIAVEDRTAAGTAGGGEIVPDQQVAVSAGVFHFEIADRDHDTTLHGSNGIVDIDISLIQFFHWESQKSHGFA